jgi:uncharacterized ubiquitin-like protein YukD
MENINNKKNIAVCFFGLCRSTNYTINSINNMIYNPLDNMNINYDVYLHTYTSNNIYNNPRTNEKDIMLDNNLYKLLNPDYYIIDIQDELKEKLDFNKYRSNGDPWSNSFISLDNLILGLYSLNQVTQLWKNSNKQYDYIMCLRPDVLYLQPLELSYFEQLNNTNIIIPNFHEYPINDRFAIGTPNVMLRYGERYNSAYDYSLSQKLHAEKYLNYILSKYSIKIVKINFKFQRIRANGKIDNRDEKLNNFQIQ